MKPRTAPYSFIDATTTLPVGFWTLAATGAVQDTWQSDFILVSLWQTLHFVGMPRQVRHTLFRAPDNIRSLEIISGLVFCLNLRKRIAPSASHPPQRFIPAFSALNPKPSSPSTRPCCDSTVIPTRAQGLGFCNRCRAYSKNLLPIQTCTLQHSTLSPRLSSFKVSVQPR